MESYKQLYARHKKLVNGIAAKYSRVRRKDTEETAQDIWSCVWQDWLQGAIPETEEEERLHIQTVASRVAKRSKTMQERFETSIETLNSPVRGTDDEDSITKADTIPQPGTWNALHHFTLSGLDSALRELPVKYQQLFRAVLSGKTQKEAAAQLGITPATAAKRWQRGLAILRFFMGVEDDVDSNGTELDTHASFMDGVNRIGLRELGVICSRICREKMRLLDVDRLYDAALVSPWLSPDQWFPALTHSSGVAAHVLCGQLLALRPERPAEELMEFCSGHVFTATGRVDALDLGARLESNIPFQECLRWFCDAVAGAPEDQKLVATAAYAYLCLYVGYAVESARVVKLKKVA